MALRLAATAAQLADLLTFLAMPREAEWNPIVADLRAVDAIFAKAALLVLVWSVSVILTATDRPAMRDGLLLICALAGAFGAGSNASVLLAR